jgi:RNA polymerase sigma-70 factor (ECF subfamily)
MTRDQAAQFVDELYDSWYARLLGYAIRLARMRSSAEEVVQEVFFDLYKALRAGQKVEYPKAWTMCVVRRKLSQRLGESFGADQPHEDIATAEPAGEWAHAVEEAVDCERVRARLGLLSPREHEVLMLRLESMRYREIAEALGISINSVNTLLARALEKLQRAMKAPRAATAREGKAL